MRIFQGKNHFYSNFSPIVSLVLLAFGFVSSGHGAKERSRRKTQSPTMVSKTPLSELEKSIQSKNPVTLQQNELQSIIDTLNKALLKNKEI